MIVRNSELLRLNLHIQMEDNKDSNKVKLFVCGDVRAPKRDPGMDAGIDLFMPNLTDRFMIDLTKLNPGHPFRWGVVGAPSGDGKDPATKNDGLYIYIAPGEDLLIPTYVKARLPKNVYLRCAPKSGVSTKQKFDIVADTIDYSYEGMLHVHLTNFSNSLRFIQFGQSIAQVIPEVINTEEIEVWYDESLPEWKDMANRTTAETFYEGHLTNRGDKGFGNGHEYDGAAGDDAKTEGEAHN